MCSCKVKVLHIFLPLVVVLFVLIFVDLEEDDDPEDEDPEDEDPEDEDPDEEPLLLLPLLLLTILLLLLFIFKIEKIKTSDYKMRIYLAILINEKIVHLNIQQTMYKLLKL